MSNFTDRMLRAAKLDATLYEEVEADESAMSQAMAVVVIANLATVFAAIPHASFGGMIVVALGSLLGWFIWAYLTFLIGTRLLPEPQTEATLGQLLRTTGFSASPGLLRVFGFIPGLGPLIGLVASVWMLVAMVIAVKHALDYTGAGRAVMVCLVGFIVQIVLLMLLFAVTGVSYG